LVWSGPITSQEKCIQKWISAELLNDQYLIDFAFHAWSTSTTLLGVAQSWSTRIQGF